MKLRNHSTRHKTEYACYNVCAIELMKCDIQCQKGRGATKEATFRLSKRSKCFQMKNLQEIGLRISDGQMVDIADIAEVLTSRRLPTISQCRTGESYVAVPFCQDWNTDALQQITLAVVGVRHVSGDYKSERFFEH